MPREIPDWKKAAIVALSQKYGYRAIASRLEINFKTARQYVKRAEEDGTIEMQGQDLATRNAS